MKMLRKCAILALTLAVMLSLLAVCGGNSDSAAGSDTNGNDDKAGGKSVDDGKPVTLTVFNYKTNFADEEFKEIMADPIMKKFPNITLQLVNPQSNKQTIEDFVASGDLPDIIFSASQAMNLFSDLNAAIDLNPILKKDGVDIGKFDPEAIKEINSLSAKGQLFAVPFSINFSVLFYNKDIFDKFAVPYPKDGLTWDDTLEIAKKLSRNENGVQYYPLFAQNIHHLSSQLSLPLNDPKTGKAAVTTDGWKQVFDLYKNIMSFPGMLTMKPGPAFFNDRTLAMFADYGAKIGQLEEMYNKGAPMNWDMVSYPVYKVRPKVGLGFAAHVLMISAQTPKKDQAVKVVEYLTSEENQTLIAKRDRIPGLKDQKIRDLFGTSLKSLEGKNVKAVFATTPAPSPPAAKYESEVKDEVTKASSQVAKGQIDVNTALRQAEEAANQAITAAEQGK
jgi:multiple sugar transport system substrate-binding protein